MSGDADEEGLVAVGELVAVDAVSAVDHVGLWDGVGWVGTWNESIRIGEEKHVRERMYDEGTGWAGRGDGKWRATGLTLCTRFVGAQ